MGTPLNRRTLLQLSLGSVLSGHSWAQQAGRTYRLGCLFSAPIDAPHQAALRDALRRSGFVEGQNLTIDHRGYGLRPDQFDKHAAELVRAGVDVILAGGDAAVHAAQRASSEIPVLALTDDMLGQGFVRSLAKPGGNTTGVTILASELDGKRQEILIEAVPGVRRIAAVADKSVATPAHLDQLRQAARSHDVELSIQAIDRPDEIGPALDRAQAEHAGGVNVLASALFFNNRRVVFDRLAMLKLPAVYQWPEMANEGGLIGYGPSIVQLYRDVQARQLVRVLNGTKPADLPVEQPTKFELVINLKTAEALGINVPQSLLQRADEVIE
jgi:ABC-type uncharacterized transport system substrate-binding protein